MKIIKDTIPNEYETKEGKVGFSYSANLAPIHKEGGKIIIPVLTSLSFEVDDKELGVFICQTDMQTTKTTLSEELYAEVNLFCTKALLEFHLFTKTKFDIPPSITIQPIPVNELKKVLAQRWQQSSL